MFRKLYIAFHGIGNPHDWVKEDERRYWCDEAVFMRIIEQIPQVEEKSGTRIIISFDDGNLSDATIATPALAARKLQAEFFPCAGRIDQPGYLDRNAMLEMIDTGMSIGSHGWGHVDWRRTDDQTLRRETIDARERIAEMIGQPVNTAAIPFGSYDRRVLKAVSSYRTVYSSDAIRSSGMERPVPRLSYSVNWTDETLLAAATEPYDLLRRAKDKLRLTLKRLR